MFLSIYYLLCALIGNTVHLRWLIPACLDTFPALQRLCFQSIHGPAGLGTPKEQKEDQGARAEGAEQEGADGAKMEEAGRQGAQDEAQTYEEALWLQGWTTPEAIPRSKVGWINSKILKSLLYIQVSPPQPGADGLKHILTREVWWSRRRGLDTCDQGMGTSKTLHDNR